jgi:hypothetical protein
MPKISTYPLAEGITLNDYLLGTQVDNNDDTKNFLLSDIQELFGGGGGGGGAISVTKTALDVLVASNGLVPGTYYIISGVDVNLYGGTTILIQAATTNTLELAGHGIFYNPKYINTQATPNNGYGIWYNYITCIFSNISDPFEDGELLIANNGAEATYIMDGFIQYISGDWSTATSFVGDSSGSSADISGVTSPVYNESDTVIWGGKKWINNTGNVGAATDKYTLSEGDWTPVEFNSTDYNVVADVIHYDYAHDMIIRRKDKWNNDVDGNYLVFTAFKEDFSYGNPIKDFQWGNGPEDFNIDDYNEIGVFSNYVKDSYLECINFVGYTISNNVLNQYSYMFGNITDKTSSIYYNNLSNYCYIITNILCFNGYIYNNIFQINSRIEQNKINNGDISTNILNQGSEIQANIFLLNSSIHTNNLYQNAVFNNNTLVQNCQIGNNYIVKSEITNNSLINSVNIDFNYLYNNSSINNNQTQTSSFIGSNELYNSVIQGNYLQQGYITYNRVSDYSQINGNNIISNSFIQTNILEQSSSISGCDIFYSSLIHDNTLNESDIFSDLTQISEIYSNKLISSVIETSTLDGSYIINNSMTNCSMYSNELQGSYIQNNILGIGSDIYSNVLNNESFISSNILNVSSINNNTLTLSQITSNILNSNSIIQNNTLDSSDISTNTLNNSVFNFSSSGTLTSKSINLIDAKYITSGYNISASTIIYGSYNKQIFKNSAGVVRLGYYNALDVFTVVNVNA